MAAFTLTSERLQWMRDTQTASMPDTCVVKRPSGAKTPTGGRSGTLADAYTNLKCEATARVLREILENEKGGQVKSSTRWVVHLPYGTVIQLDDQIWVTPAGSSDLVKLQVVSLLSTESWETAVGVECNRIQ